MIPAARAAAAIEVLTDIDSRRRPAADAMKDWGLAHRFAGSGDRAAISALVYDVLRKKSSSAWIMGEGGPRAEALGALRQTQDLDADAEFGRRSRRKGAAALGERGLDESAAWFRERHHCNFRRRRRGAGARGAFQSARH